MKLRRESSPSWRARLLAASALAGVLLLVAGCEDDAQGGIGASASLPSVLTNFGAEDVDVGVGNVQWVGNPRW